MKNTIIIQLLLLLFINCFSQNSNYKYNGRLTPSVKKEKLNQAKLVSDITPDLWHKLVLPYKEQIELDSIRRMDYSLGYYLFPQGGYDIFIDYVSVEISGICNGKIQASQNTNDELTTEQKNILNTVDPGTDIRIKIKFKYKNKKKNNFDNGKIIEGELAVTAVPETEAEYPGGFKQLTEYLTENVINKISEKSFPEKIRQAIVKFTVNEEGQIVAAKIFRSSTDLKTDILLLNAITKMPKWKPAKNSKGIKVKQEFSIPFGNSDGC
jgi:TonB family protein